MLVFVRVREWEKSERDLSSSLGQWRQRLLKIRRTTEDMFGILYFLNLNAWIVVGNNFCWKNIKRKETHATEVRTTPSRVNCSKGH